MDYIEIKGAAQNNLKNIDIKIPKKKFIVITGVSGSGKSSLAYDTIFSEGERRYLSTLSLYARQYLKEIERAEVNKISGLSPTISVEQKTIAPNPRSTVGSVSEIYDYLRLLFAKVGDVHCPQCGEKINRVSKKELFDHIIENFVGKKVRILSPVVIGRKGEFGKLFQDLINKGFTRVKVDGEWKELDLLGKLDKSYEHSLSVLIDSVVVKRDKEERIRKSLEKASELSGGLISIEINDVESIFTTEYFCPKCGISLKAPEPRDFSYNSPYGYCPLCKGLGFIIKEKRGAFEIMETCSQCNGKRLNKKSLSVKINGKDIAYYGRISIKRLREEILALNFHGKKKAIADKILSELKIRLDIMERLSLDYLSLFRPLFSLSGGEAQRIRIASQLGLNLRGVIYVLDEPSIGLHPYDHKKLLSVLEELKKKGNTIIVVEHDEETIKKGEYIIDMGPGGGDEGGKILFSGKYKDFLNSKTLTALYLKREKKPYIKHKRKRAKEWIEIKGARANNLKNINVKIPLGVIVAVTGVSGSGKSSLIFDVLYKSFLSYKRKKVFTNCDYISGFEFIKRMLLVDQSPIGKNIRSTPATYSGVFSEIRKLFSMLPESKSKGYDQSFFSYNASKGRCHKCDGKGLLKVELGLLPPVYVKCDECGGKRYGDELLSIKYKGKNIYEILELTVEEAWGHFKNIPSVRRKLEFLVEIGMGYIKLGQPTPRLSGGESQRIKLAKELGRGALDKTVYLLDEPSVGLHFGDVKKLLKTLRKFSERGDTVIIIEHNSDIIYSSDYVIDLGPEGGEEGGYIVATGTPEEIMRNKKSKTLKNYSL